MSLDQLAILLILLATIGMFLRGRWRHDMVAAGALLASVAAGLVAPAARSRVSGIRRSSRWPACWC